MGVRFLLKLQALAGRYDPKEVVVTGDVSYNDVNASEDGKVQLPPPHVASRIGFCYEGVNSCGNDFFLSCFPLTYTIVRARMKWIILAAML